MRTAKRFFGILLSAVLLLSMGYSVKAAEDSKAPYTYTIRILAGKQGSMTKGAVQIKPVEGSKPTVTCTDDMLVISNLQYGDNVIFVSGGVTQSEDNKYYVKGFRESGKDTKAVLANTDFLVTEDRDYVVAYGLRKDMVPYVIRYQDADGNTLAESETYYGSIGDKPVVAYLYVDGYQPQAYNLTKTLTGDPEEDIFTFTYTPIPPGTVVTRYTTIVIPGTYTDLGTEVIDGGVIPGGEVPAPGPGGEEPGPGGEEIDLPEEDLPLTQQPSELEDLDIQEEELPLSPFDNLVEGFTDALNGNAFLVSIPMPVKVCVLLILVVLLALGIYLIVTSKTRKKS